MRNDQVELTNKGLGGQTGALAASLENLYATGSTIAFSEMAASNDEYMRNKRNMEYLNKESVSVDAKDLFRISEEQETLIHDLAYKAGFKDAFKTMLRVLID